MVRRASRLPSSSKSLEEVVLDRIANGAADTTNSTTPSPPPSTDSQRRSAVATIARISSGKAATPTPTTQPANTPSRSPQDEMAMKGLPPPASLSSSPSVTLEKIESVAKDVARLNQRLQSVATSNTPLPTNTRRASRTSTTASTRSKTNRDQIEQYIHEASHEVYAAYATRKAEPAGSSSTTTKPGTRATHDPAQGAQINHAVRELRSTVKRLDKVFYEVATGDKQRHLAATSISTIVRGFLVRRRYKKMKYALGQWRQRKCQSFLTFLDQFSARETFLQNQIFRLHMERTHTLLRRILAEIRDVALMNLPMKRKRLDEVDRRFQAKQHEIVKTVFTSWKQSALGPRSRKKATAESKRRHTTAKQKLELLDRFEVITCEMVHDEFLKENIRLVRAKASFWKLKTYFTLILKYEYWPMKHKKALACAHARKKMLTFVWRTWLPQFRASQVDKALAKMNERRTLDRFEKHHNLRKIDAHYRKTHAKKHFTAWAIYGQRIKRVRKLFEDNTKSNMAQLLQRWHVRAQYQHALRKNATEEWQAYSRRIFQTPFRVWYSYASCKRANRKAKETICVAYQRRQRRHTKYTFFRLWKHQILFGTIDGIQSKMHLLRNLEDQKRLCLGLEANAKLYQANIEKLQDTIEKLEEKVTQKQQELINFQETSQVTRFSIHTAEQSIARVQGLLEAVRTIHPGTVERIEKMFMENPLLTQDLKKVVALHVQKRNDVLNKIQIDETEMEIQLASSSINTSGSSNTTTATTEEQGGRHVLSREDHLLLHRVKWVLSRLDLHGTGHGEEQRGRGGAPIKAAGVNTMDQLCALFEFIRDGETRGLTTDNDPSHPRSSSITSSSCDPSSNTSSGQRTAAVDRIDLTEGSDTWHSFLQALTVKFAPQQMLQVKERLVKRAAEMDDELLELHANPQIYNAYSGSAHPSSSTKK